MPHTLPLDGWPRKPCGEDGRKRTMISQSCQAKEREGKTGESLVVKEL